MPRKKKEEMHENTEKLQNEIINEISETDIPDEEIIEDKEPAEGSDKASDKLLGFLEYKYRDEKGGSISPAKRRRLAMEKKLKGFRENIGNPGFVGKMYVDYADMESGDLTGTDPDGIDYMILADDVRKLFPKYIPYTSGHLLGATFKASVKAVSEEGIVYLDPIACSVSEKEFSAFITSGSGMRQSLAAQLEKAIITGLSKQSNQERPVLRGEAVKVEPDCVFVDVFNTGIIAIVVRKHFARRFHRDLRDVVQVGDTMRGVIYGRGTRFKGDGTSFYLMNTSYHMAEDGWKRAQHFKKGDTIVIRCVGKPEKVRTTQQYFWGVSLKMPGIDLMSDFSTKVPEKDVQIGGFYKCKIKNIDTRLKQVKVVPFEKTIGWNFESPKDGMSF